jgi:hypothetical protein
MKQKIALKDKKLRKQINKKFNNVNSADENKQIKISLQKFLPLSEAEIQSLLRPTRATL